MPHEQRSVDTGRETDLESPRGIFYIASSILVGLVGLLLLIVFWPIGVLLLVVAAVGGVGGVGKEIGDGALSDLADWWRKHRVTTDEFDWEGTGIEGGGPENRKHRTVNAKFDGGCPVCGEFAALRATDSFITDPVAAECAFCEAGLKRKTAVSTQHWELTGAGPILLEAGIRPGKVLTVDEWSELRNL